MIKILKIAVLITIPFLFLTRCFGQESIIKFDSISNRYQIDSVLNVNNTDEKVLYNTIKLTIAEDFNSAKEVIQLDDIENGRMICTAAISYESPVMMGECYSGIVKFKIKIFVKSNKYKMIFTDFRHVANKRECSGGIFENEKPDFSGMLIAGSKKKWRNIKDKSYKELEVAYMKIIQDVSKNTNYNPSDF